MQANNPFYPAYLLPALQSTLATLADLDRRYEIERDYLEGWTGPDEVTQHRLAKLETGRHGDREPILGRLNRLQN